MLPTQFLHLVLSAHFLLPAACCSLLCRPTFWSYSLLAHNFRHQFVQTLQRNIRWADLFTEAAVNA